MSRILREPDVERMTGMKRTTLWRWRKRGLVPQAVQLGPRAIGWRASDVEEWVKNRPFALGEGEGEE